MNKISPAMPVKIRMLVKALKMSDADYRTMLSDAFKVESSLDLSFEQGKQLIDSLERTAIKAGVWEKKPSRFAPPAPKNRPGMATDAQMWKIRALWKGVTRAKPDEEEDALKAFLKARFKIEGPTWITFEMVPKVMHSLIVMKRQANEGAMAK